MVPVQIGIPGGPELLILLLILGLPLLVVLVLVSRSSDRQDRLSEIERRIGRLEARVDGLEGEDGDLTDSGADDRTGDGPDGED